MNLDDLLKSIREEGDSKGGKIDSAKFLNTKTFTNPLKGQRYQAPGLPSAPPVVVKPTVLKIDPKKIIPENVDVVGEEFGDKIDELIQVIREDNKLEEKSQKEDKKQLEAKKKKDREDRIETKKETKFFIIDLKKSIGKFGGFFDSLKKFFKSVLLGALINSLYNFFTDPKNKKKVEVVQGFLRDWWPALAAAIGFVLVPFKGLILKTISFLASTTFNILKLFATNPIFAIAVSAGVAGVMDYLKGKNRKLKLREEVEELMVSEGISETEARRRLIKQKEEEARNMPYSFNPFDDKRREILKEAEQLKNIDFERTKYGFFEGATNRAPGFKGGGFAMGTDIIPAMLTPGEFIMSRGAVNMFGADTMMAMNKAGGGTNRPKYGKVLGYSGGGLFGEAPLTKAARAAGYRDKELAAFLAQMSHETGNFQFKRELSGGASHYGGGGPYTLPDGKVVSAKYHGRGYVQLTHDYNYKKYGDRLGIDLLNNPELALDGDVAARIAVEYWKDHVRPTVKGNWDNVFLHSKAINLPSATSPSQVRGMEDRQKKYNEYLKKIMSQKPRQIMPAMPTAPGSLGPAFSDDTTMRKQQDISSNLDSIRTKLTNPIDTFLIKPFKRVFTPGTPNVPTETKNFVLPAVDSPKQNQSSSQTNDVPNFSVVSGNKMRDLISMDLGISDLAGVS